MFFKTSAILFVLLLTTSLLSCKTERPGGPSEREVRHLTDEEAQIAESGNHFGFSLFQTVNELKQNQNIFISPFSISMALGMAVSGAEQTTLEVMKKTLALEDLSGDELNAAFKSLMDLLTGLDPKVTVEIANSIWYRQEFSLEPDFVQQLKINFSARASGLDFNHPEAVKIINQWVAEKTNGRINEIVDRIPPEMVLYLINAIYFKGFWKSEFNPSATRDDLFYPSAGVSEPCQMMLQTGDFAYLNTDVMQVIDLPYGDGAFSMTILLPHSDIPIESLAGQFNQKNWHLWLKELSRQSGTLYLPKFTLEYEITLNDVLKKMGMAIAFEPDAANFTRINKEGKLYLSQVRHKTFVKVDEEGTEAAAVTSVEVSVTSVGGTRGFVMRVERPFLFVIRERHSQSILFVGKVITINC